MSAKKTYTVRTPLGVCEVALERSGLNLGDRGGFDARWLEAEEDAEALSLEAFRQRVKAHLSAVYVGAHGQPPGAAPLNLASHQLVDDLIGWTKLNWR